MQNAASKERPKLHVGEFRHSLLIIIAILILLLTDYKLNVIH
jgi:hypothetical protein